MEAIKAEGFSFRYPHKDYDVLGPVDWSVPTGAFVVLMGATGCGKTTLLRCLKPSIMPEGERAGTLRVLGREHADYSILDDATHIGYVAQDPDNQMVCDSVWHEIAFGLENSGMPSALMRRRVAEVTHFFGMENIFRKEVACLSGGQKQMVALASALALQPQLLILDEPTSQLDPVAEKSFLHALFRVNRELGITVVVATHSPETMLPYATQTYFLRDGCCELVDRAPRVSGALQTISLKPSQRQANESAPVLVFKDVSVRYARDADWVLRGFDLSVGRGEIHAVVGGNGSGKSTLLRVAAGVMAPERGRVVCTLKNQQALLPQQSKVLFACDSVIEELREWQQACGYSDEAIAQMLKRFGLVGHVSYHPYDLSGGQQQLLALAKLLLTRPQLLLLDEPTQGLDVDTRLELGRALQTCACEGVSILMVTHDLSFAGCLADTITLLFDGQATCSECPRDFFADNLFYRLSVDGFLCRWHSASVNVEEW